MINVNKFTITVVLAFLAACAQKGVHEESEVGATQEPITSPEPLDATEMPSANGPIWKVGDTWRYSDGYELKVSLTRGEETTFQRVDILDDWLVRRGLFKVRSKQGDIYREVVYRTKDPEDLFPLSIGRQVVFSEEYMRGGDLIRRNTSWTVEGRETIQVPAGTFNCWVLVMRTRGIQSDWTGMERWWYSPEVKHYIRLEYRYGTEPAGARVLMNYTLVK
ncbi:conserved hypothetical protein [Gammaproteobacteria bacterium]